MIIIILGTFSERNVRKFKHKDHFNTSNKDIEPEISENKKDIFLDTDDESQQSVDLNEVVSFNMERKYANTMESCSKLSKLKEMFLNLKTKLSNRTHECLNNDEIQQILKFYKVEQMGLKSQYDKKKEILEKESQTKALALERMLNINRVLMLEKIVVLNLLKKKGKKDKELGYESIVKLMK